jgi:hypothetical protein
MEDAARAIDGKMGQVHDPPEAHEFEQRLTATA